MMVLKSIYKINLTIGQNQIKQSTLTVNVLSIDWTKEKLWKKEVLIETES